MLRRLAQVGLVTLLSVLVADHVEAQMPLSIVAGPTFANLSGDDADDDNTSSVGVFVGVGTRFDLNETFSVAPYLSYIQKGAESESGNELSLDYFEIPVFLSALVPVGESAGLRVYAGPQIGFNVNCDAEGEDCSEDDDFNSLDYGLGGGAAIGFPLSDATSVSVGGGVDLGLADIFDDIEVQNRVYYLFAQLGFALGG